jgi:hypothetical protein
MDQVIEKFLGLQATRGGAVATKVHETAHKSAMCAPINPTSGVSHDK